MTEDYQISEELRKKDLSPYTDVELMKMLNEAIQSRNTFGLVIRILDTLNARGHILEVIMEGDPNYKKS